MLVLKTCMSILFELPNDELFAPESAPRVHAAEDVNLKAIGAGYKRDADAGMPSPDLYHNLK